MKSFNKIKRTAILKRSWPVRDPYKIIKSLRENWNIELSLIQQLHFWVYTPKYESRDLKRYLHTSVHNSIIYNSQKVENKPNVYQ